MASTAPAEIVLYTNHACPWAHRVHIALALLDIPFTERIIDLDTPRTASYLAVNPRGQVPTLVYNGVVIPESGPIAQFLSDAYPGILQKSSSEPGGALQRLRTNLFVDAWVGKVVPKLFAGIYAEGDAEKRRTGDELVKTIKDEIEPLLADAAPFFGGSATLTLAEVQTGSFILRLLTFPKHGLISPTLVADLESQTPHFFRWANAVVKQDSVTGIWDEEYAATRTAKKVEGIRAAAAASAAKV